MDELPRGRKWRRNEEKRKQKFKNKQLWNGNSGDDFDYCGPDRIGIDL